MRVWIDLTNSPHVLVMRPVIEALRDDGHEVQVTARDFAQTLELLDRFGIDHVAIGRHRGGRLSAKAGGLISRSAALVRFAGAKPRPHTARGARPFDVALGHGSNDVSVAAALLRIPSSTMFDYEWAALQHQLNCRLARTVVVPDAIPRERLFRYGARAKIAAYPGLKEEYYLADFEPDPAALTEVGVAAGRPLVLVRTPPDVALYHRFANDLFGEVLERLRRAQRERSVQIVVLPRTPAQRARLAALEEFIVPERAVDAQSLVAFADLVISAGGTMNREAVALGTPVLSTFQGRLGAVDERLLAEGRMRRLSGSTDLEALLGPLGGVRDAGRAEARGARVRRDPRVLLELLLTPLARAPQPAQRQ
jgi:predicted glycosyltransferase